MAYLLSSVIILTIAIIYIILDLISNWKVFVKCGDPGWKSLIPFYDVYVECKHFWTPKAFIFLLITAILGALYSETASTFVIVLAAIGAVAYFVLRVIFYHYKSRSFGKGVGMTLLLVFFPFIANLILGLGSAEYVGNTYKK